MKALLLAFLLAACGANQADPHDPGSAGAAGAESVDGCERSGFLGSYVVSFEKTGGDCGTPGDERATIASLESVYPCERVEPDAWSADGCTWRRVVLCGDGRDMHIKTELSQQPDGGLSGTERRSIADGCSGEYAVRYVRQ